jgi:hypothetical protein
MRSVEDIVTFTGHFGLSKKSKDEEQKIISFVNV